METIQYHPTQPIHRPAGSFFNALSAEVLKMKRSLALWLTLVAPLTVGFLQLMVFWQRVQSVDPDINIWLFINRQNLIIWTLLMQPLFVTLETALVAQLDHAGDHWKHLFALPLPRWTIYVAKLVINLGLIGISMLVLYGCSLGIGLLLRILRPEVPLTYPIPFWEMLRLSLLTFASSWLIIAIHHWVSLRWRSFVVASAFGIVMTVAGIIVINHEAANYYPWTLSALVMNNALEGLPYLNLLAYGCLGAFAVAIIGCLDFIRRDVL